MDLSKSRDVFDPSKMKERIHIIGCGSVGSSIAELLARCGLTRITLYDFDVVEPKNIANQMFFDQQIGQNKTKALADLLCGINPDAKPHIKQEPEGWTGQRLNGYVFLCVDSIETRKKIVDANRYNVFIKAMFDVRTALYDAQGYAADWSSAKSIQEFRNTMNFTHSEATAEVPMSACGEVLGVAPTVRVISNFTVINFLNLVMNKEWKSFILVSPYALYLNEGMVIAT